ncbi:MAG: hypothetical protein FVQ85_20270 [Planctomycetes bacterium]|nr:hypothetical protein [Planctomycetota bacterium]
MNSDNLDTQKLAKKTPEDDIKDSNTKRIRLLRRVLRISLLLGFSLFLFGFLLVNIFPSFRDSTLDLLFFPTYLLFFLLAITMAIAIKISSLRSKIVPLRFSAIASIVFLSILLLVIATIYLQLALPFIYTSPALTPENLYVFDKCIEFVQNHNRYKNLTLSRWRWVSISGDRFYLLRSSSPLDKTREFFSESEIAEMEVLAKQLHSISCQKFRRDNDIVLFYKTLTPIPPVPKTPDEQLSYLPHSAYAILRILPSGPGVAYSLHGKNPNEIKSDVLNPAKPFIYIGGNWYLSRHLMLRGIRSGTPYFIPKSFIDHSLRIEGLNLNNGKIANAPQTTE